MDIPNVISLLGGVALFLFGMSLMGEGLKKIAGNRLEVLLYKLTNTSWKGILLGTMVTAVIQSSSATSVMVVGFVNSKMMRFRQAIGIILGAIFGTSVTGWVICLSSLGSGGGWVQLLSTTTLTGIIAIIGIILRMFCKSQNKNRLGDILMGFAVLMFGMSTMSGAVAPLKESGEFIQILTAFSHPLLGILVGMIFTAILQSASAAVGILQALTATGAVDFATAFPLIMGIAIGAALPVLLSSLGANVNGKRTAFVYLLIDMLGVAIWSAVFYTLNGILTFSFHNATMTTVSVALLNTVFRLATVLILSPFVGLLEKAICFFIKDKPEEAYAVSPLPQLEERFIPHPALAIAQCREFITAMAKCAQDSLTCAFDVLENYSDDGLNKVMELENLTDQYEDSLGTYLVKVTTNELSNAQNIEISKFLHTLSDFERIADHALNIAQVAQEIDEKSITYSDQAVHELSVVENAVKEIVSIAIDAFSQNNLQLAAKVEPLEELIDGLCDEMKLHHVDRIQKGVCSLNQGFTFNDLLTNYERISDHCSNIAVAMIELETDSFNTHEYLKSMEKMKQASFVQHFEEFRKKYTL
ncbi:MAG: Na/Pi cotransporter family protein [Oscillospiraceae bacterium]|nr:Na/Pi cotransporter family protein [Oscillospiraceae bacterium]